MAAYRTDSNAIEICDLGSGHSDVISIFSSLFLVNFPVSTLYLSSLMSDRNEISLRYNLGRFVFEFHKIWIGDDVIVKSFKLCPYLKFYWTYKLHTLYQYTTWRPSDD